GYDIEFLQYHVARALGQTQDWDVVIVGVGRLASALAAYNGFSSRGIRIAALVDSDPSKVGTTVGGLTVSPMSHLASLVQQHGVAIAVIATPGSAAQGVADELVAAGITSILNFAPALVTVPSSVI